MWRKQKALGKAVCRNLPTHRLSTPTTMWFYLSTMSMQCQEKEISLGYDYGKLSFFLFKEGTPKDPGNYANEPHLSKNAEPPWQASGSFSSSWIPTRLHHACNLHIPYYDDSLLALELERNEDGVEEMGKRWGKRRKYPILVFSFFFFKRLHFPAFLWTVLLIFSENTYDFIQARA